MYAFARRASTAAAAALVSAPNVGAQVVRGTVTSSGADPVPAATGDLGVLASLVDTRTGAAAARTRVAGGGRFTLSAPNAGGYRTVLTRVGYRAVTSPAITLSAGDTVSLTLAVPSEPVRLSEVLVQARGRCAIRSDAAAAAATLWATARDALEAAATAEGTVALRVRRYVRDYTPDATARTGERIGAEEEVRGTPFAAVAAESLAARGYVRRGRGGAEFLAPDARTLLSDAFAASHCFEVGVATDSLVGLDFEPTTDGARRGTDVGGTLWLARANAALRALTFRYDELPPGLAVADGGGRLDFRQLPGGAWIVDRWAIRVALLDRAPGAVAGPALGGRLGSAVATPPPPRVVAVREVGGEVVRATDLLAEPAVASGAPAAQRVGPTRPPEAVGPEVVVTVRDSAGALVAGAVVRVNADSGAVDGARTDSAGVVSIGRRPAGRYVVDVRSLGFRPQRFGVAVPDGLPPNGRIGATFSLTRAVPVLADVRVSARPGVGPAYARRTHTGVGLDRAAIEGRHAQTVSDLFSGLPGVQVIGGIVTVPRLGSGPLLNSDQPCTPVYYVDGARMAAAVRRGLAPTDLVGRLAMGRTPFGGTEVSGGGYFSPLLGLTPNDLESVTVYTSLGGLPPEYASQDATCGVIVVTTRRGPDD